MPEKLEITVHADTPSFTTRRVLRAPRALVFECWTRPEHLKRWMGPATLTLLSYDVDLRVGGGWRFVQRAPDGTEFAFRGTYLEIVRPERLVSTMVFEPFPDAEAIDTLTLEERDGLTIATTHTLHKSFEARDGHLQSGMEGGMNEGYRRLDALLVELGG